MPHATMPLCRLEDVGITMTDDAPAVLREAVTSYFARFLAPIDPPKPDSFVAGNRCLCGRWLSGMFGSFTWGLAHGEGFCGACRHPARAYHCVPDGEGGEALSMPFVLLYAEQEGT